MAADHNSGVRSVEQRAAAHAALGDPSRLALVDDLRCSDRSPSELSDRHHLPTNLLAHHLDVLARAGIVERFASAGDGRRRYVRLVPAALGVLGTVPAPPPRRTLFLCSHNSARSQLAAALWTARTGMPAASAGTHPALRVHRGAVAAARRAGVDLGDAAPRAIAVIRPGTQVVTVCDRVHEELDPEPGWWHWSLADPVPLGNAAAFDAVVADTEARITVVTGLPRTTRHRSTL